MKPKKTSKKVLKKCQGVKPAHATGLPNKTAVLAFQFSNLFNRDCRLITLLLVVVSLLVYGQVYEFEFLWDEISLPTNHLNNPFVANPSWQSFTQLFTQPYFAMYVPISYLFWGILKSSPNFSPCLLIASYI